MKLVRGARATFWSGDPASLEPPLKGVTNVFFVLLRAGVKPILILPLDVGVLIWIGMMGFIADFEIEDGGGWVNVLVVGRRGVRNGVDVWGGRSDAVAGCGLDVDVGAATSGRNGVDVTGGNILPRDVVGVPGSSSPNIDSAFRRASSRSPPDLPIALTGVERPSSTGGSPAE